MTSGYEEPRKLLTDAGRGPRAPYRKPRLQLHGTLEPRMQLGSPPDPPPPAGTVLGIRGLPW